MIENLGKRRAAAGFSLVEMAVVALLIGIFLTMGLSAFRATQEASAVSQTQTRENAIKDALIAYIRRNNRLPCPDAKLGNPAVPPDGNESRATAGDPTTPCIGWASTSRTAGGILPYVTLGLSRNAVMDGWGNFFSYQVSNRVSSSSFDPQTTGPTNNPLTSANTDWTLSVNLRSGSAGEITVNGRNAAGAIVPLTTSDSPAVATVISHGPNGFGAYTLTGTRNVMPPGADELENTNAGPGSGTDATVFHRTATTDDTAAGGAFDDHVMYLTADDLLGPLFKDGSMKPPMAQLADTFHRIENAIGAWAAANTGFAYYRGSSCTSTSSGANCRVIPFAGRYRGNGEMDQNDYGGGVPWASSDFGTRGLSLDAGNYPDTYGGWNFAPLVMDPWGRPIRYSVLANVAGGGYGTTLFGPPSSAPGAGISNSNYSSSTPVYSLTSFGPDRTAGTPDDITVTVNVGELGLVGLP